MLKPMSRVDVFYLVCATVAVVSGGLFVVSRIWPRLLRFRTWRRYWLYLSAFGAFLVLAGVVVAVSTNIWVGIVFIAFASPAFAKRSVQWRRARRAQDPSSRDQ